MTDRQKDVSIVGDDERIFGMDDGHQMCAYYSMNGLTRLCGTKSENRVYYWGMVLVHLPLHYMYIINICMGTTKPTWAGIICSLLFNLRNDNFFSNPTP